MKTRPNPVNFYKIRTATEATQYLEKEKRRKKKKKTESWKHVHRHAFDTSLKIFNSLIRYNCSRKVWQKGMLSNNEKGRERELEEKMQDLNNMQ